MKILNRLRAIWKILTADHVFWVTYKGDYENKSGLCYLALKRLIEEYRDLQIKEGKDAKSCYVRSEMMNTILDDRSVIVQSVTIDKKRLYRYPTVSYDCIVPQDFDLLINQLIE